jgi:hypothetical protein
LLLNFKIIKSEEWRKCEIAAKKATKKWKSMGRPRDENNKHFVDKKETRANLRKSIAKYDDKNSIKNSNAMMEANFRDPKLLTKLVRIGRKIKNTLQ